MDSTFYFSKQYTKLKEAIFDILLQNGMKKTTMDMVASTLSMSKRTLYEIFDNKEQMIKVILEHSHKNHQAELNRIFTSSDTMMEAFFLVLKLHLKIMMRASSDFIMDMDSKYAKMRPHYDDQNNDWQRSVLEMIKIGIRQGVFSKDIKYPILVRMFNIQMESLKRMEEFLPKDVTLSEAFNTVSIAFLRSIATEQGLKVLEEIRKKYPSESTDHNQIK